MNLPPSFPSGAQRKALAELARGSLIRVHNGWSGRGRPVVTLSTASSLVVHRMAEIRQGSTRLELHLTETGHAFVKARFIPALMVERAAS